MKKILILLGASQLVAGCFLPVMSIGDDTLNFFNPPPVNIPGVPPNALIYTAIVFIAIALTSFILALFNKTTWLWLAGIVTGALLTSVYFGMHAKVNEMKDEADRQINNLFGGMFKGVADSMFQTIHIQGAGWYVIGSGSLLLFFSLLIKKKNDSTVQN